jgi:hypothetical protein
VGDRWGREGSPEDAYGWVTDSGRYATLPAVGWELLNELERRYAVTRATSTQPEVHGSDPAPVVRLVLRDLLVALTAGTFGERVVRDHGWWHERWYQAPSGRSSGRTRIDRQQRRALQGTLSGSELRWAPWPERAIR